MKNVIAVIIVLGFVGAILEVVDKEDFSDDFAAGYKAGYHAAIEDLNYEEN